MLKSPARVALLIGENAFRLVTLLLAASIVAFALMYLSPIDPVQQYVLASGQGASTEQRELLAEYWGLNDPPVQRYLAWLTAFLHGDMGTSLLYRTPVSHVIMQRFWNTFLLMAVAWVLAGIVGYVFGALMGVYQGSWFDKVFKRVFLTLYSTPTFWLGMLFLMVFAVMLKWFPIGFSAPIGVLDADVTLGQRIHHLVLPALTLSFIAAAPVALHTRAKFVDVMNSEYVVFAKARGEDTLTIVRRHGMRNTLLPMLTLQFASFGELFGGSILAETVFSYPGLGSTVTAAGLGSDVPLLLGITMFATFFVFLGNMTANLLYGVVDPRINEVAQ